MRNLKLMLASAALAFGVASAASAALPSYPTPGIQNPFTYTFTAAATGDVLAYYAIPNVTASYTEDLGLLVNGTDTGLHGLQNQSTAAGTAFDFGSVNAGDALTFYIRITNPILPASDAFFYSNTALNADHVNHVYAAPYAGGDTFSGGTIPAGTYVAFEDLAGGGDLNYHDEAFVFTNVAEHGGVPEPLTWSLMIMGFGAAGAMLRRARQLATA